MDSFNRLDLRELLAATRLATVRARRPGHGQTMRLETTLELKRLSLTDRCKVPAYTAVKKKKDKSTAPSSSEQLHPVFARSLQPGCTVIELTQARGES